MKTDWQTELLSSAQMRALELAEIARGGVTGLDLMERAGRAVVAAIFVEWPEIAAAPHKAVMLCGPGNNGGDGFVIARLLKEWGWEVAVFLSGDARALPPDARVNHDRWLALGSVHAVPDAGLPIEPGTALVIDALFGTGLARPVAGAPLGRALRDAADCIARGAGIPMAERLRGGAPLVVAVDIPSGLCADSGRVLTDLPDTGTGTGRGSACAGADLTVSFHRAKLGHHLADGPSLCGRLAIADIGLGPHPSPGTARLAGPGRRAEIAKHAGHKYAHGHALVLAGGFGCTGAARLAARGALRVGAGLVSVAAPEAAMAECAAQLTAIMLRRCDDGAAVQALLHDPRFNAVCVGPGLGIERARHLVPAVLANRRATVLDADALSAYGERPEALFEMLNGSEVLTPHDGEFARLFPDLADGLAAPPRRGPALSRLDVTRAAAERAGCVVLLKGPDTVIAGPDGRAIVSSANYHRAAPWLATAGSGDVLAGMIAGLLARGFEPLAAAERAAWLHVEAARQAGPGLVAEDIPEALPGVFRALVSDARQGEG